MFFIISRILLKKKSIFFINKPNANLEDNSTIRDYIHLSDISRIILKTIFLKKKLTVLNCGRGQKVSTQSLIKNFQLILKKKVRIKFKMPRKGDPAFIVSNTKEFEKNFKKFKFKNLKFILKDYVKLNNYIKKNLS